VVDFSEFPVRLTIASDPAHLPVVRAALERFCALLGLDEPTAGDVVLAVDEALTNVIKHAYHGAPDRPIEITFCQVSSSGQPGLEIRLRDWGEQTEPGKIRSRDLQDVRPGGLGVHIMRQCMDRIDYTHAADGGTILTMVKLAYARSPR
jgi:anti-sigma regulatory factor (Ser/Thr protein kinase)